MTPNEAKKIKEGISSGSFPLNLNGHFSISTSDFDDPEKPHEYLRGRIATDSFPLYMLTQDRDDVHRQVMNDPKVPWHYETCNVCGERVGFVISKDQKSLNAITSCAYSDGFPPIKVELKVPSGEIVLFNDLRKFYPVEKDDINVCALSGQKAYTELYAKEGMILQFVSNTSPTVFQPNAKTIRIGGTTRAGRKKLGSICTDLWWYSAADSTDLENRMMMSVADYQALYASKGAWPKLIIAQVIPGVYEASGLHHLIGDQRSPLYSEIVWKRELTDEDYRGLMWKTKLKIHETTVGG